jgi:hypothetical protein
MSAGESAEAGRPVDGAEPDLANAANVLVLSERLDSDARAAYLEELVAPDLQSLLVVSFVEDPARWLDDWAAVREPPGTAVLVEETEPEDVDRDGVEYVVGEPADLTGLGITVSEQLTNWEQEESLLMFESLTTLLDHVELKRLFRFLHVLVNRVRATGSTAHYHLDPTAHDDRTIATLTSLFDAVVAYEDGRWQLSSWP